LELHFGEKVKEYMSKKMVKYKNIAELDEIKTLKQIDDFLPLPEDLVYKSKLKKVTLALSEESIEFFKKKAKELNSSYQPMIRSLLDEYTRVMKQQ